MSSDYMLLYHWPFLALGAAGLLVAILFYCFLRWLKREADFERGFTKRRFSSIKSAFGGRVEQCPICLDYFRFRQTVAVAMCEHTFHVKCLEQWLRVKAECPVCKRACGLDLAGDIL